jgi:DNA adenine methylase
MGGKRRLTEHLIARYPRHSGYAEVFAGGAALFFMRPPADIEVINVVNG